MSDLNRREVVAALSGLAMAFAMQAEAQTVGEGTGDLNKARTFPLESAAAKTLPNGSVRREIFSGTLATGEAVNMHVSVAPAGTPAPAAHRIMHSEFTVVLEGTMEFFHDGTTDKIGPGGTIYVAYGTNHYVKNAGTGTAKYMVFSIGGDVKKA